MELERNLANVCTILEHDERCKGVIHFNEFTQTVTLEKAPPWALDPTSEARWVSRRWVDSDDVRAEEWLERAFCLTTSPRVVRDAAIAVASRHPFHPVRDYFGKLQWDRTERLSSWLTTYCGAEPTPYTRAVGRCWPISAVARIQEPGVKADHALIFEGPQGFGKSSACEALAGDWFTDDIDSIGSKDAAMQMQGVLIVELGELTAMARAEVERVKQWLVRRTDRFRAPYGRSVQEWPRQCIFAGTVNPGGNGYLRDETGNRRFWPVKVGRVNIDALRRDRDQLWAEAVAARAAGEKWWLDGEELVEAARDEQEQRVVVDAWESVISRWLVGKPQVTVGQVLKEALNVPEDRWSQTDQNRVAKCLRRLKRERKQIRIGRDRAWVYIEQDDEC